jgi:S-adenosyl-L-methionine hydrolase (adenosine-forming)
LTAFQSHPIFAAVAESSITSLPIVTLTTDFGSDDWYVAAMKAVLLSHEPAIRLVDVTHTIPPGDVIKGSITLERAIDAFPPGTIHLAVIDPGVGSSRRALIVRIHQQLIICPDNGLITWAWRRKGAGEAHQITWQPPRMSQTFHGRDLFAPVAAMVASGKAVGQLSVPLNDPTLLDLHLATGSTGQIIHIDRFGNATTNIAASSIPLGAHIRFGQHELPLRSTYSDVAPAHPLALIGSSDLLQIAVRDGSASERFSLNVGKSVTLIQ